jgi:hypothetical protein
MKRWSLLLMIFLSLSFSPLLSAQGLFAGFNIGPTFNILSTSYTLNGEEYLREPSFGPVKALPGYHVSAFGGFYLTAWLQLRAEIGYERLRFRSRLDFLGVCSIHHLRTGMLLGFEPFDRLTFLGGLETVRRTNNVSEEDSMVKHLNGREAAGLYWQGTVGVQYKLKNALHIGVRMSVPRIRSLTFNRLDFSDPDREYAEQMRAFQLVAAIPLVRE